MTFTQAWNEVTQAVSNVGDWLIRHDATISIYMNVLMVVLLAGALYIIAKRIPSAWGSFVESFENGLRTVLDWPRKQKMRREKQNRIDNQYADALEDVIEKQLEEGLIDPTYALRQRIRFGRVLKKMMPKRDVKKGIKARLQQIRSSPDPQIPGDAPIQDVKPPFYKRFGWTKKPITT